MSEISKILVNNKYKFKLAPGDTAIWLVDIPKASKLIENLFNKETIPEFEIDQPRLIGTLTKPFGIKGCKTAEIGHNVYETQDRYLIYLDQGEDNFNKIIRFYKHSLEPFIFFTWKT